MRAFRTAAAVIMILAVLFMITPRFSRAAVFTVALEDSAYSGGETTSVFLSIHNDSAYDMTEIYVTALGQTYGFPESITAGQTQDMQIPGFRISQGMIGKWIEFELLWKENGESKNAVQTVYIQDAATAEPDSTPSPEELIEFTCSCDNPKAENGEKVRISYKIVNNSWSDMTDITITDSSIANGPIVSGKKVESGSEATFNYDYVMGDKNITASPIMSYMLDGTIRSVRGNTLSLESVTVKMDVNIVQLEATEKGTEFVIKIANNGNRPISSIRIYQGNEATDDTKIQHAFDLGVGEAREISYMSTPKGKADVTFIITGKLATGEVYEYKSETYTVWEFVKGTIDMQLTAEVASRIDKDGYVGIDFTLKNLGDVDMKGITLSEDGMGKIGVFTDLAGGGEEVIKLTLYAGEARDMHFTATALAPTGQPFEYTFEVSAQEVANGTDDVMSSFGAANIDVGSAVSNLLRKILTVLAVISGIFGVALVVLSVFEFQQNAGRKREESRE